MAYNKNRLLTDRHKGLRKPNRIIYYGQVVSIDDPTDGGIIKVRIPELDNGITIVDNLPNCYPFLPKNLFIYPKVDEYVRVIIEDVNYTEKNRYWIGSLFSQLTKLNFEPRPTANSTMDIGDIQPGKAPSQVPEADGVYPKKNEIGILGRLNTDIILRDNQVEFRAGKHENDNPYKLNIKNPASISLNFDLINDNTTIENFYSNNIIMADKIGLISHSGNPKFKSVKIDDEERERIFNEGHPIARGDVLVEALNIMRNTILNHIHGYAKLPADKDSLIKDLENINFDAILQKNIVTN